MKYFVTGATGFIGGAVARQLAAAGHDVIALVRTPAKAHALADLGITLAPGDITDAATLRDPMTGVDGVFHIAGWYKIGVRDKAPAARITIDGTRNVLETMRDLGIPKGVYTSTIGVFSNTHGQVPDETYRYDGPFLNEYERTKWIAHYEIAEPLIAQGLPLVIVMPGVVYGPGDTSAVGEQIAEYLRGRLYVAPRETAYCWAHIDDVARGHLLAMERGTPGASYILAGQCASFLDVLKIGAGLTGIREPRLKLSPGMLKALASVVGVAERYVPLPELYSAEGLRTLAGVTYLGSNAKAQRELGYTVRPLVDGLRETVRHEIERLGLPLTV
jgi:nucleoside-diphosphate-sugar epimerase